MKCTNYIFRKPTFHESLDIKGFRVQSFGSPTILEFFDDYVTERYIYNMVKKPNF